MYRPVDRRARLCQVDPHAPVRRVITGLALFLGLIVFGVSGYMIIEGWSFFDALYMTVTTVTTVGYREVQPLGDSGRAFTIVVVLFGVGVAFYMLTTLVQTVIEGEFAQALGVRRMQARIAGLRDHYILCGFGRVGEEIAHEYNERDIPFVIVENNEEAIGRAEQYGYLMIPGDATQDAILKQAGIRNARALMAASDSDAGNTYITLTANALQPQLFVIARVGQPASESRVRRAGADRVISPYKLAGRRMAVSALQPLTVDFFDVITGRPPAWTDPRRGRRLRGVRHRPATPSMTCSTALTPPPFSPCSTRTASSPSGRPARMSCRSATG